MSAPGHIISRMRAMDESPKPIVKPLVSGTGLPLPTAPSPEPLPVLIIGAGITGLCLAQSLLHSSPPRPFRIFERDPTPSHRGAGWGLTIHWALDDFLSLIPRHLQDRIEECFVDGEAVRRGEEGHFLLFNLKTGEVMEKVPPNKKVRVRRERLRALLMEGIDIEWNKSIDSFDTESTTHSVAAIFTDGTTATGSMLIGCDGSRSRVRCLLCPHACQNNALPVRILGVSVPYTRERCKAFRDLDPYFFQATDPITSAFVFFSFLTVPPGDDPNDLVECQLLVSWPLKAGFLGREEPTDTPVGRAERLKLMKEIAQGWCEPYKSFVLDVPGEIEVKVVRLEDWVPGTADRVWDNRDGRVTLVGDAAHAMTMYRGEAANHGIKDVAHLYKEVFASPPAIADLKTALPPSGPPPPNRKGVDAYEQEMIPRTKQAVLNSRRACLDANDHKSINKCSPLVSRRAVVMEDC